MTNATAPAGDVRAVITIPTYNNRPSLRAVVERALSVGLPVLLVNDGSTDGGPDELDGLSHHRLDHPVNRGKGAAIISAARWAEERGFTHIITVDADEQHDPAEVSRLEAMARRRPRAIVIGTRDFSGTRVPRSSRFGRRFSNFWLRIACGVGHPDSQSGFRCYPLVFLRRIRCSTRRYDFEIEILVRSVWAGACLEAVDISVRYDEQTGRASHFRHWRDNARISWVYARLIMRNFAPWPHRVVCDEPTEPAGGSTLDRARRFSLRLLREGTSPGGLASAAALGVFLGTLPLIACHCVVIVFCATRLRLNRLVALSASHLCAPPLVPALAIEIGFFLRNGRWLTEFSLQTLGHEFHQRLLDYLVGSLLLGPALAIVVGGLFFAAASLYPRARRRGSSR